MRSSPAQNHTHLLLPWQCHFTPAPPPAHQHTPAHTSTHQHTPARSSTCTRTHAHARAHRRTHTHVFICYPPQLRTTPSCIMPATHAVRGTTPPARPVLKNTPSTHWVIEHTHYDMFCVRAHTHRRSSAGHSRTPRAIHHVPAVQGQPTILRFHHLQPPPAGLPSCLCTHTRQPAHTRTIPTRVIHEPQTRTEMRHGATYNRAARCRIRPVLLQVTLKSADRAGERAR